MRGGKIEGKEGTKGESSETGIVTDIATTISVAEETNASSAGTNKACSNGGSRKDECGDGKRTRAGAPPRRDSYAMEVDRGRNCYACGGFEHMACHCRNRGRVAEGRRIEFKGNYEYLNTLKGKENLESLN